MVIPCQHGEQIDWRGGVRRDSGANLPLVVDSQISQRVDGCAGVGAQLCPLTDCCHASSVAWNGATGPRSELSIVGHLGVLGGGSFSAREGAFPVRSSATGNSAPHARCRIGCGTRLIMVGRWVVSEAVLEVGGCDVALAACQAWAMERQLADLPPSAMSLLEQIADRWSGLDGLSWAYGQGSMVSGFSDDSDLDLIAVWDRMPVIATVAVDGSLRHWGDLAMEQCRMGGFDIDIQHVPRRIFDDWVVQLSRGQGWSGEQWPMPVHVAAGLAEGVLLCDRSGAGAELRARFRLPEARLVDTVVRQLAESQPGLLRELVRARTRGDWWLHDLLAIRLHKLIYTGWFLAEGHYPPFPKYLDQWIELFGMDDQVRQLEAEYWAASDCKSRDSLLSELAAAVVRIAG